MSRHDQLRLRRALIDEATGLPAFQVHFDALRRMLDARPTVGVVHLEIEEIARVESLYGWQVLDQVVGHVARALECAVGAELPAGTLLALCGVAGDRFLAFVPELPGGLDVDGPGLGQLAGALGRHLDAELAAPAFAGLAPAPRLAAGHALLAADPFLRFERCVNAAVERARGAHARRQRDRERSVGEELDAILRGGALAAWFQPVVRLPHGELLGHEALIRGPRDSAFEAPRVLFELSGRLGRADELDRLCLRSAVASFAGLPARGKLFLNVLPTALDADGWRRGELPGLLTRIDLEPAGVVLELSDRGVGADAAGLADRLRRARDEGFGVALDDVGTGASSLAALERARPDYLKLDATLVRGIDRGRVQQAILRDLARLAGGIGAEVIAEGVETAAEALAVAEHGARLAQGYHFATPAPAGA